MKYGIIFLLGTMLSAEGSPVNAQTGYFVANHKRVDIRQFDRQIEQMLDDVGSPGASIAIIDNNKVVYTKGYGYKQASKKDRVDDSTVFEACSISKTYVSYVALKLVEEGKLDLDKPVYQYLENPQLAHDQRYKLITARMLLSHCSGIENWIWDNDPKVLDMIATPGEKYTYSGAGITYLANVLESILQKPYEQYVKEMILDPLGLHNTFTTYKDGNIPSDYALGTLIDGKEVEKWKNKDPWPAAGVNVCAGDYARFLISVFDGTRLADKQIRTILTKGFPVSSRSPQLYFGTGFPIAFAPNDTIINFTGSNIGFKVFIAYSIVHKTGFAVFSNYELGQYMSKRINGLTAGLDLDPVFQGSITPQYPDPAYAILRIYRNKGKEAMFAEIERRRKEHNDKTLCHTIDELADMLYLEKPEVRQKMLTENISCNPNDPTAYYLMGQAYKDQKQYAEAITYYLKSKNLKFNSGLCDDNISECERLKKM